MDASAGPPPSAALYMQRDLSAESDDVVLAALQTDAVARRILAKAEAPSIGSFVGVRLNINVLRNTGCAVHSIHRATSKDGHMRGRGFYRGEVITYLPVVTLQDAYFNVHQGMRESIANGSSAKCPMASVDGTFIEQPDQACFDGVRVRFNPKASHLFVDDDNYAVEYAEHVTILGHRAFCRGRIRYFCLDSAPKRAGDAPSVARFAERGRAINTTGARASVQQSLY